MCNCITETEKQAVKLLREKNPDKVILNVELLEIGFGMAATVTYTTIKYSLSGKSKKINIYHSFCPFCGKKYPNLK